MATPQRVMPVLPADVWRIVFSEFKRDYDLTYLWTECRNVSKLFRDEVEHVFKTKHLPKTSIAFDLGTFYWSSDDEEEDKDNIFFSKNQLSLSGTSFDLDRFAHNEKIAIYKLREGCVAKDFVYKVFQRLPFALPTASRPNFDRPKHYINIRREVNDTEVPGLALDKEKEELNFDWRGMYAHFYAEEKMFDKHQEYWFETQGKPHAERVRARIESREISFVDIFPEQLKIFSDAMQKNRQLARRARVRRQWREHLRHMEVDDKDAERLDEKFTDIIEKREIIAFERLNAVRCALDWEEFSDDEVPAPEPDEDDEDDEMDDDEAGAAYEDVEEEEEHLVSYEDANETENFLSIT